MTAQRRRLRPWLFWVAPLALAAAVVAAPLLSAERFAGRIRAALESSLGRPVEFREPRFNLLRGPGFSIRDVVIHEDPAFGLEPMAYARSLEARIDWKSLLAGRLAFSNLRLEEPSVTLGRNAQGMWNIERFFSRLWNGRNGTDPWPAIQIRGGRVNWKQEEWKSVYYFSEADIDLYANFEPAPSLVVRFSGAPARTDRAVQSFGAMRGRLRWLPGGGESRLQAELELERSSIGELMILAHGEDVGVHGAVSGRARFEGPLSSVGIAGQLEIESLYRWDQTPGKGEGRRLPFRGVFNAFDQSLALEADAPGPADTRMRLRLRVADVFAHPRWAASLTCDHAPLLPVAETAAHMGSPAPPNMLKDGSLSGAVVYSPETGFRGQFMLDAAVHIPGGQAPVTIEQARLVAAGGRFEMPPALLRVGGQAAQAEAGYELASRSLKVRFSARALPIATVKNVLARNVPAPFSSLVEAAGEGACSGVLQFTQSGQGPGEWSAEAEVREVRLALAAFSAPLLVSSAHVSLTGGAFRITRLQAQAGGVTVAGEAAFDPGAPRPLRLQLWFPKVDAGRLEKLLAPVFRGPEGFLQRTLHIGRPAVPHWLEEWRAEGALEADLLTVNRLAFREVRCDFIWDGTEIEAKPVQAWFENGALSGALAVRLSDGTPRYRFAGRVEDFRWQQGKASVEGVVEASGTGPALLRSLRLKGALRGQSLGLLAGKQVHSLAARGEVNWRGGTPDFRFTDIELLLADDELTGSGRSARDGTLRFDLAGKQGRYQILGKTSPLSLELNKLPGPGR